MSTTLAASCGPDTRRFTPGEGGAQNSFLSPGPGPPGCITPQGRPGFQPRSRTRRFTTRTGAQTRLPARRQRHVHDSISPPRLRRVRPFLSVFLTFVDHENLSDVRFGTEIHFSQRIEPTVHSFQLEAPEIRTNFTFEDDRRLTACLLANTLLSGEAGLKLVWTCHC